MPEQLAQVATTEKVTALDGVHSRLYNYNNTQVSILCEIETKLHLIVNKRVPESDQKSAQEKQIADKVTELHLQCDRLDSQNNRLEKILNHLSEIV